MAPPASLRVTPGDTQVSLSWSSSVEATSYHIKRADVSGGPYVNLACPTGTSYVDNRSDRRNRVLLRGLSRLQWQPQCRGESANSSEASATPQGAPSGAPSPPSNLTRQGDEDGDGQPPVDSVHHHGGHAEQHLSSDERWFVSLCSASNDQRDHLLSRQRRFEPHDLLLCRYRDGRRRAKYRLQRGLCRGEVISRLSRVHCNSGGFAGKYSRGPYAGCPGIHDVPAKGTPAMAAASTVNATRSSFSR